jgi:spermidine synthase
LKHGAGAGRPPITAGAAILGIFFFSGACGLLHEVAWMRLLRHVIGNDTLATATVLGAFMTGLALGSALGGRWIDRRGNPLIAFAVMEAVIGIYTAVLPWVAGGLQPLYRYFHQNVSDSEAALTAVRFLFAGLLLLLPTTLMGATLPVLSRYVVGTGKAVGAKVGRLYGINTFGAVAGTVAAGFLLIPNLGLKLSIWIGSLANLLVAAAAWFVHVRYGAGAATGKAVAAPASIEPVATDEATGRWLPLVLLVGYGLSGTAALIYEVAWTRVLSMMIGSSVYAFSMMLAAFILGLALGSVIAARWADRLKRPMTTLAVIEAGIALSALAVVPLLGQLPFWLTRMITNLGGSFGSLQLAEFAVLVLVMLVPTTLMGAAFPLANRIYAPVAGTVGRLVGTVYAWNTVGAILGSVVGGLVLIPWIGLQNTIYAAVWINVAIACTFFLVATRPLPRAAGASVAVLVIALAATLSLPTWSAERINFGPLATARRLPADASRTRADLQKRMTSNEVVFHETDRSATVAVKRDPSGGLSLWISGKPESSTKDDMNTQVLLSQLPLLMHPAPENFLLIGVASGVTLGSAGRHDLEHIDGVEIVPAVLRAARQFDAYNYGIFDDPRVRAIAADGRNHLALTDRMYDVIVSAPTNAWVAGVGDLLTREYFELASSRLNPGGIVALHAEAYSSDIESFRRVVRTFLATFPHASLWNTITADYLLIGTREPLAVDYQALLDGFAEPRVAADLQRIGVNSVAELLGHQVMGSEGLERLSEGAELHTDDNAWLEFHTPRNVATAGQVLPLLTRINEGRLPDFSFLSGGGEGGQLLARQATGLVLAHGYTFNARTLLAENRQEEAIAELARAAALAPGDAEIARHLDENLAMARRYASGSRTVEALFHYSIMLRIQPYELRALTESAVLLRNEQRYDEAGAALKRALAIVVARGDAEAADQLRERIRQLETAGAGG